MRGMKTASLLLAPLVLAGSPASAAPDQHDVTYARLGQTVRVHGVAITPLSMVEDSRCPADVTCVWAGRVRLNVRIDRMMRELTLGEPVQVIGGTLRLASVLPQRRRNLTIPARAYRFGFRFDGRSRLELIRD
jgi:hypothetical protein